MTDTPITRARLKDGVYLDLPFEAYLADDATSGSDCLTALLDPGALQWEREDNPLYDAPAKKVATRGSAQHAAILEGLDAYESRYVVPPAGVLKTGDDMSDFLRKMKERGHAVAVSGKIPELRARIEELRKTYLPLAPEDPPIPVFMDEAVAGKTVISAQDDKYIRLLHDFVTGDPELAQYLAGGFAEVSIFATIDGHRYKGRLDLLAPNVILNLKTYSKRPRRGNALRTSLVRDAYYNGTDLQAVVHHMVTCAACQNGLPVFADSGDEDIDAQRANQMMLLMASMGSKKKAPVYQWLFIRTGGAPTAIMIPFRESEVRWQFAVEEVREAVNTVKAYRAKFKPGQVWTTNAGVQEINSEVDWPFGALGSSDIEVED